MQRRDFFKNAGILAASGLTVSLDSCSRADEPQDRLEEYLPKRDENRRRHARKIERLAERFLRLVRLAFS